jgi:manganese transport protein
MGWLFTGPAVVASIAYIDPGNFAANIQAGAKYGYSLLWVVLAANLIAMLFQALSAKLGIVTGRNLAELSRERFPQPVPFLMWIVSEIAAMATDLAEFLGGSIGLSLLAGVSLLSGMAATAIITYAILMFGGASFRRIELAIGAFVAIIGVCYVIELFVAPVSWAAAAQGMATLKIADDGALMIAVGIVGATVMPHAIYLHSALTQSRTLLLSDTQRERVLRFSNREVVAALSVAGCINMAMVIMAAAAFNLGHPEVAEIETAYHTLTPLPHFADCFRHIELGRWHNGRPGDLAGVFPPPHSNLAAAACHDGARLRCRGCGHQRDEGACSQPGFIEPCAARANDRSSDLNRQPAPHGPFCQ